MMQNWFHGFNVGSNFDTRLRAFSAPFYENADSTKIQEINYGGKILLPPSVLDSLLRLNIQYPMLFKLSNLNPETQRATHCGVLEFNAEEGRCYLPAWMMGQLCISEGDMIRVDSASLPKATHAKLKPQSTDFLNISNPRAVLEVELRKFACLSINDRIAVRYADTVIEFLVQELKPANAVCIIECDLNLDFDAPEGYVDEHVKPEKKTAVKPPPPPPTVVAPAVFAPFGGTGARLDGKKKTAAGVDAHHSPTQLAPIVVDVDYKPGKLAFVRYDYHSRVVQEKDLKERLEAAKKDMSAFSGSGATVRNRK